MAAILKEGHKGGEAIFGGEAFDPSIDDVGNASPVSTLPGGMKLAFVPKKPGRRVHAQVTMHYGTVESLKGTTTASQLAAAMLESWHHEAYPPANQR